MPFFGTYHFWNSAQIPKENDMRTRSVCGDVRLSTCCKIALKMCSCSAPTISNYYSPRNFWPLALYYTSPQVRCHKKLAPPIFGPSVPIILRYAAPPFQFSVGWLLLTSPWKIGIPELKRGNMNDNCEQWVILFAEKMELPAEQPADHSEIDLESDRKTKEEEQWHSQVPDNTRPCAPVYPTLATLLRSACMMKLCNTSCNKNILKVALQVQHALWLLPVECETCF